MRDHIVIKGARENNLKNIDVEIPRDALVVMTGLSGSGKSSLAFDTIFAEGQRRYMESLSSYALQFLGQMDKPDVDSIDGMSPAISIDQKTTSKNPRSTVGTVTEIYDYLRLLWARVGVPHCPKCGKEIRRQTVDQIVDQIAALPQATRVQILAPVIRARKGEHQKVFDDARRGGYVRVRVDGSIYDLTEVIPLDKNRKHNSEIGVDRVVIRPDQNRRLTDAVEIASALSGGLVLADIPEEKREILFSQNYACDDCGISIEELTPRMFSFNSPYGACPTCGGKGKIIKDKCSKCSGTGFTRVTRTVTLNVPAGVDDGQNFKTIPGEGEPGRNGGPAGDLYITCTVRPHKIFKRDRYDLYCDVPVSFTQAALGGEIDVPTLGGTTKYNIPAGTQEGTSFRIRGEGIQQFRGTNRGDMFFTVHVEVPKHLGEKQKELLRQFEDSLNGREYERRKSFGDQVKSYIRDNAERFKEKFEKK